MTGEPASTGSPSGRGLFGLPDTPFLRFGRTHGLGAMSDAMLAVALAGSIFFSIDPDAARWRVALYLVLTIAPFAVVTPLLGPLVDRVHGGRRGMILTTIAARLLIAWQMIEHLDGLLLFPLAFGLLVMQKTYSIAKSAVVPSLVRNELELVEANAKLAMLSAVCSMVGAGIGGIALMASTSSPAVVAVIGYGLTLVAAIQVPKVLVAPGPTTAGERAELRQRGILTASLAVGLLRAVVGFTSFLLAFEFRGGDEGVSIEVAGRAAGASTGVVREASVLAGSAAPVWHFGLVLGAVGGGAFLAAQFSPVLRRRLQEERIIRGVLFVGVSFSCVAVWLGGLGGAVLIGGVVAACSGTAKLAFDSLVQRDAPGANHGRSFARFEGRFQLAWAIGGFLAVFLPLSVEVGYVAIAGTIAAALTWFGLASPPLPPVIPPEEPQRPDGQLGFWRREDLDG
ncbi:MAG TPA: hypothetical protein DGF10_11455 [Acidimicrobiaceae bacterium]|nr:hypothetical protein [Acidimicrobiaceae bacterium]HCV35267.1 hypothetical protein [Acidimicrobiaceae bacterium]